MCPCQPRRLLNPFWALSLESANASADDSGLSCESLWFRRKPSALSPEVDEHSANPKGALTMAQKVRF